MTRSPLWREFESGETLLPRLLRFLVLTAGIVFLLASAAIPLPWPQQALLGGLLVLVGMWLHRASGSYLTTLTLVLVSCFVTLRYGIWRGVTVERYFRYRDAHWSRLDAFFVLVVLAAEFYAFLALILGYVQTLWPLRRTPVPLPDDPALWPEVDLLIPTYNEPLRVVKHTVLAAMNIDWPEGKLNVYLLDDGRREEFREFAEQAGIGYMTRPDNEGFKAGNINRALSRLSAPFVAIFDADHVPTRSFLQLTMGWFDRDSRLALLQTPQHYYSPDPFERNLDQFRNVPNENELFYGVVQDGNDLWNATSFCGSCAVLRRSALDEIGGLATETVTEDAHTSLRLQKNGWSTAYINIPQAAGLATERLTGHIRQRVRWARGMIQILRLENPLFGRGLKVMQRLCYFNAAAHFLFALPRLVFLTAPLIYLIFGGTNLPGLWAAIVAYALPHLVLLHLAHSRIQGRHRHSFWNEIYETVLAPYILFPTLGAFLMPRRGRFNVTAKGQVVATTFFDRRVARPFVLMLLANLAGLLCAIPRAHLFAASTAPGWQGWLLSMPHRMYDGSHVGVIGINVAWTLFNVMLLSVATAVSWESQQRRRAVRVNVEIPAGVVLPDGSVVQGLTGDLSNSGVLMRTGASLPVQPGDPVRVVLPVLDGDASLPATVVGLEDGSLRAEFDSLSLQEEEALTMALYSRADSWLGWGEACDRDRPLRSLARVLRLALRGLRQTIFPRRPRPPRGRLVTSVVPLVALAMVLPVAGGRRFEVYAQTQSAASTPAAETAPASASPEKSGSSAKPPSPAKVLVSDEGAAKSEGARAMTATQPAVKTEEKKTATQPAVKTEEKKTTAQPTVKTEEKKTTAPQTEAKTGERKATAPPQPKAMATAPPQTKATPEATGAPTVTTEIVSAKPILSKKVDGAAHPADGANAKSAGEQTSKALPDGALVGKDIKAVMSSTALAHPASPAVVVSPATPAELPLHDQSDAKDAPKKVEAVPAVAVESGWPGTRAAVSAFYDGRFLPVWERLSSAAAEYPWALVLMVILQSFLMAVLLRAMLRRRARERLLGNL
jgi:cellulose synthase (UDP-forming)